jgi:hypothetical protein
VVEGDQLGECPKVVKWLIRRRALR